MRLLLRLGRPDDPTLARIHAAASLAEPTYDFVRATVDPAVAGPHEIREHHRDLGRGDDVFAAAIEGMRAWVQHRGVLARVHPEGAGQTEGATVVVVLPAGPVALVAPCRIVGTFDEPRRVGFAYGSLPGHPASGEEAFLLDHLPDGTVRFTIRVTSVGATPLLRLVEPAVALFQRVAIARYLGAMQTHVARRTSA